MNEREIGRAVTRAEGAKSIDVAEATALLAARGEELDRLMAVARRVRDAGLAEAGRPDVVTYSRKVFIPLTRLCRDRCHYCTFVTVPGKLVPLVGRRSCRPDEVLEIARAGASMGCKEALFTLGDRPEDRWPEATTWLAEAGYDVDVGVRARHGDARARGDRAAAAPQPRRHELGGDEPAQGRGAVDGHDARDHVASSVRGQGSAAPRQPGQGSGGTTAGPGGRGPAEHPLHDRPARRASGRPSPSGPRASSSFDRCSREFGHVQEVIVQNFRAKPDTAMRHVDDLDLEEYLAAIATTRVVLGPAAARPGTAEPGRPD